MTRCEVKDAESYGTDKTDDEKYLFYVYFLIVDSRLSNYVCLVNLQKAEPQTRYMPVLSASEAAADDRAAKDDVRENHDDCHEARYIDGGKRQTNDDRADKRHDPLSDRQARAP